MGIDFRPATGQLYALSSRSALYTINISTGAATIVGSGFTDLLTGSQYGFNFNPVIDRIRIVGDSDQNLVAHPDTGAANVASPTPSPVAYATGDVHFGADPNIVHSSYTNSFLGATSTQLYGIDSVLNILVTQANNAGTLVTIGSLGAGVATANATGVGGFDIAPNGTAYAAFTTTTGSSTLYTINLATGTATSAGLLSGTVSGLAVVPEPSSVALLGVCGLGLLVRRRRA